MRIDDLSFPHPVLGLKNNVEGEFDHDVDVTLGDVITIGVKLDFSCPGIQRLIKNNKAAFCTEVDCLATIYRESFLSQASNYKIELEAQKLSSKVDLAFFLVATDDINDYSLEEANPPYDKLDFKVEKGDVLGFGGRASFPVKRSWKELDSLRSVIEIKKMEEDKPMYVQLATDRIIIRVNEDGYEKYSKFYNADEKISNIFHSSIVLPALTFAIEEMAENPKNYKDTKWYQILQYKKRQDEELSNIDIERENALEIAQIILDKPVFRTLDSVEGLVNKIHSEE